MPRENCAPCCNPPEMARSIPTYHEAVLVILCEMLAALQELVDLETAENET